MLANTAVWIFYAMLFRNYFLFFANFLGYCLSLWYTLASLFVASCEYQRILLALESRSTMDGGEKFTTTTTSTAITSSGKRSRFSDDPLLSDSDSTTLPAATSTTTIAHQEDSLLKRKALLLQSIRQSIALTVAGLAVVNLAAMVAFIVLDASAPTPSPSSMVLGVTAVVLLCCFNVSPLATLAKVLRHRNAESLDPYLAMTALLNGSFWVVYGMIHLKDPFVWGPNIVGAAVGFFQIVCILACRRPLPRFPTESVPI